MSKKASVATTKTKNPVSKRAEENLREYIRNLFK
jgi:hypothetical protein